MASLTIAGVELRPLSAEEQEQIAANLRESWEARPRTGGLRLSPAQMAQGVQAHLRRLEERLAKVEAALAELREKP